MFNIKKFLCSFVTSLLILIASTNTVFAITVNVTSYPPSIVAGQQFDVIFTASGLVANVSYYAKALGGDSFNEVDTWNGDWLQQNASWTSMPAFTSDDVGNASVSLTARFDADTQTGTKEFKIRINKSTNYDSSVVNISVSAATPSPTSTPTPTSNPTSAPTATPVPTSTSKPAPTKTPTPKPSSTPKSTSTPEPTSSPEVLGESDMKTPSPTPEVLVEGKNTKKFPWIAGVMIALGVIFAGVPVVWFLRQRSVYNKPTGENS